MTTKALICLPICTGTWSIYISRDFAVQRIAVNQVILSSSSHELVQKVCSNKVSVNMYTTLQKCVCVFVHVHDCNKVTSSSMPSCKVGTSLVPRLSRREERAWEPLHAHAPILPGKHGKPEITVKLSYSGPESREGSLCRIEMVPTPHDSL